MQFFKQLTDPALKRLYKFVLKRLIGRFLAEDEIDLDQLDVHLRSGRLELCDLLLNAEVLNEEVFARQGLPFRVKKGYLGSVRVTISYTNIMSESCLVEIDDIEIVLVPVDEWEGTGGRHSWQGEEGRAVGGLDAKAARAVAGSGATRGTDTQADGTSRQASASQAAAANMDKEAVDEISQEGLDFVASWIEQVTSKIKVTLSNICLRLETNSRDTGPVALLCKLEWAQFTDESASEVASVYAHGGLDQSKSGNAQSMNQSMAASSLFGISQKGIKFHGISIDLLVPDEVDHIAEQNLGEEDTSVVHTLVASESARQCYVQVKLSHYEALDAPTMDVDLFVHSLRGVFQPQHFPSLGVLLDAFSTQVSAASRGFERDHDGLPSMYASVCESQPAWLRDDGVDDDEEESNGELKLSFREFQRIEQLLQHYHRTHEELRTTKRDGASIARSTADFQYPIPRRLSAAESVESVGLSDLEGEDDSFFECETGAESISADGHFSQTASSNLMAQSMYASALYGDEDDDVLHAVSQHASLKASIQSRAPPRHSVQNRFKIHLLECNLVVLYEDIADADDEEEHDFENTEEDACHSRQSAQRRSTGLPILSDQEHLEVKFRDIMSSVLAYESHSSISFTIGTFEIAERTSARMSTHTMTKESEMLSTSVLKFADTSPTTGRKVNLSANLSAQIRVEFSRTDDGGQTLSRIAVQVSAQPILLEWDMYLLDRAHRLLELLEQSNPAASSHHIGASLENSEKVDTIAKSLDVNTECAEITLRFPMVNSDLIRFGPSSKRGLCEDRLVLSLDGVKVSSYYGDTVEDSLPSDEVPLPWLSEICFRFDYGIATILTPRGANQRSTEMEKSVLLRANSDVTSGDVCQLRIRIQTPSPEQIRTARTAKEKISQDSLENLDSTSTSFGEEKSGDDNDGGRVGLNGWSQDARVRAHEFEKSATNAALFDLNICIPQSKIDILKTSYDRMMILFDALLMINPIDINGHNQMMSSAAYRRRLIASYMTLNMELKDGTIQIHYSDYTTDAIRNEDRADSLYVYHFAFQDARIFQVSQWMGQLVSRVHVTCQNATLLEEHGPQKVVAPVLYKNPIGVTDAPILFVGMDIVDQTQEMREMKVDVHCSQVNLRYEVTSKWLFQLLEVLVLEYPLPIISLDSATMSDEECAVVEAQIAAGAYETVNLATPPKTVFTKLFVSLYDAIVDYAPNTLSSRAILILGNVGISSNVVTGALIQGYKITVRDVQLFLTPDRPAYDEFDDHILGKEFLTTILRDDGDKQETRKAQKTIQFAPLEQRSRGQLATLYPSLLVFFEKHRFLQIVTMDIIDIFARAIVPAEQGVSRGVAGPNRRSPAELGSPELSLELNLGTANIYACFDSFNTLIEVISTWTDQLNVEAEPRDTTAYVGLDRVRDSSSVSVVTNLGPSSNRGRSALPSDAGSLSAISGNGGTMFRGSSRTSMQSLLTQSERGSFGSARADEGDVLSQLDTNAFGSGQKIFPGKHVATDTEARLLRTRLHEIEKEKNRIVGHVLDEGKDDTMSATELRQKYKNDSVAAPRVRINELVIEDYYNGNRKGAAGPSGGFEQNHGDENVGAFLLEAETPTPQTVTTTTGNDPWFSGPSFNAMSTPAEMHPVGSLPDEQAARWLPPGAVGTDRESSPLYSQSSTSSPRFDAVDDESVGDAPMFGQACGRDDFSGLQDCENVSDRDYDEYPDENFHGERKNWWGQHRTPTGVELSELQTEPTESAYSHQLPFTDDGSDEFDGSNDTAPHPLSLSIIGTGADEGTEVELDFTLDKEMQFKFNHMLDFESNEGIDEEDLEDSIEMDGDRYGGKQSHTVPSMLAAPFSPNRRSQQQHLGSSPRPIPERTPTFPSSNGELSRHQSTATMLTSSPPDEPTARWYYDELPIGADRPHREGPPSRIIPHHVEIPIGGSAASLSFGERECDEAIRSIARENAARKMPSCAPVLIRHVLLRDFNICMRFFGGSDWSRDAANAPTLKHRGIGGGASTGTRDASKLSDLPTATLFPEGDSPGSRKEKLLDALLDNYVPSTGSDLFGSETQDSLFGAARSAPATSRAGNRSSARDARSNHRASSFSGETSTTSRKRPLKTGRKTEEMLELVITRIQLRVDMYQDDEHQPLASNAVVALGDVEILDYISTSQIRKIICYWKSDVTHPRESGSSMVRVHLMTVRPGPNLCEEHRLKMTILPLRVNLDQEVVNFLRQFVPTETVNNDSRHRVGSDLAVDASGGDFGGDDNDTFGMEGTELSSMFAPMAVSPQHVRETDVSLGNWFFQNVDIRPCKIKIDYRPNHVDYQALRAGDYLEVINLFVLEDMELVLRRVRASGVDGWMALGENMLMSWVNDISRHQIHKCVASVSMPPLRSFANVGSGAADLILLPLEHYGRDRRVVRGLKKGAKSFLKSVTIETLNTASKVAQGTQALLEHADDVVSYRSSRKKQIRYRQAGSRIARNSKRMGGGGIRSAQDRGGIGSRQYLAQQPATAAEGFYQAYDSFSRELHTAAKTIVAVPLVEYKKTGSQGYVRSVIRAVPVAVLRPMIGATEAMSKALLGVRNAVDPELKEDVENKFKDFRAM